MKKKPVGLITVDDHLKILTQKMVLDIIDAADYDLGKAFNPKLSEDPEEMAKELERIVGIAFNHIKNMIEIYERNNK